MGVIAWIAVLFSFVYLYFAIKNKAICFVFGIVSSGLWAYESYFTYQLKFDAVLQIFYVLMSMWGFYRWQFGGELGEERPILRHDIKRHIMYIIGGVLVASLLIYGSQYIQEISKPKLDALTSVFFVIGTILLIERELYSWLYLVVCNIIMVYVYGSTSAWLFMAMMVFYTIFGLVGFLNWLSYFRNE